MVPPNHVACSLVSVPSFFIAASWVLTKSRSSPSSLRNAMPKYAVMSDTPPIILNFPGAPCMTTIIVDREFTTASTRLLSKS